MKYMTSCHWLPEKNQHIVILSTSLIEHSWIYVSVVSDVADLTITFFNKNNASSAIPINPMCITNNDKYYTINKSNLRDK